MATTITPQSLTVTLSTTINLNGQPINSENQLVIPSITSVDKRIVTVPTSSEVQLVAFSTVVGAGTLVSANLKYLHIVNKDAVNYARIRVTKSGGQTFDVRVDAGQPFIMGNTKESVSATAVAFSTFDDATSINAQAYTAPVDVEIFAASI
jgi:hypothetical protein